jgi:hypothetical protein
MPEAAPKDNSGVVLSSSGVQTYSVEFGHVDGDIAYDGAPPVGGKHNPKWQNCGIYDTPLRKELAVHSLEHGAVWLTYRPDLPADQIAKLKTLIKGNPYGLMSPYPDQPSPIALTAWSLQLRVDSADDARISTFIKTYSSGPQTPELGAPCNSSIGAPSE